MKKPEKKALRQKFDELRSIVDLAVRREDPMGLLATNAPLNEYDPEVGTILPKLKTALSEEHLAEIIGREFSKWFGEDFSRKDSSIKNMAHEIWDKYHASKGT